MVFYHRILLLFDAGTGFIRNLITMEKIKNGDPVMYRNLKGTIYGKPRENKYRGLLYTVRIGDEYYKASASELTLSNEDQVTSEPTPTDGFQLFARQEIAKS